ncbi:hypothetical protein HI914_00557 [Erysiphe necator]|nr:hypothetical protein HI914_00557 [Erysiphe necator]
MLLKLIPLFFMLHGICISRPMMTGDAYMDGQTWTAEDLFSMYPRPYQPPPEAPEIISTKVIGTPQHEFGPGRNLYPVSEEQRIKDRKASQSSSQNAISRSSSRSHNAISRSSSSQSECCIIMKP